eukprot:3278227-Rhodomonas_salina.1
MEASRRKSGGRCDVVLIPSLRLPLAAALSRSLQVPLSLRGITGPWLLLLKALPRLGLAWSDLVGPGQAVSVTVTVTVTDSDRE